MKEFVVHLQCPSSYERIDGVTSFFGLDDSGSFAIWGGHERMMTVLRPGIARLKLKDGQIEYLGLPESALYFVGGELSISGRKYMRDSNYANLSSILRTTLQEEEVLKESTRETIANLEEALLKQLLRLSGKKSP